MRIHSRQDFWAGIIFLVIGVAFVWGSKSYEVGTAERMGPGYFPWILGVLTAVIGVLVILKSLTFDSPDDGRIGAFAWRPLFFIITANLVIGVMLGGLPSIGLPALGLVLGTYALTFIAALAGNEFRFREVFILATVLAAVCFAGFVVLLKLPFQVWPAFLGLR
jgi:hypothetical protein